jgi:hypothetical protein
MQKLSRNSRYQLLLLLIGKKYWIEFAELYDKYKLALTTNWVEGIHSTRRKYADKRLNFASSYETRANMALLSMFLANWIDLVKYYFN